MNNRTFAVKTMRQGVITRPSPRPPKRILKIILCAALLALVQAPLHRAASALGPQQSYEAYYRYLGDYPVDANPGWHQDVQGITHDQSNWFITQTGKLWKIPVSHDLSSVNCGDSGVVCRSFFNWPELAAEEFNHLGDPEFFEFGGQGFVLVPLEGGPNPDAVAAFRADTLQYIDHTSLNQQSSAPWLAIDPQGVLYSSNFNLVSTVKRYFVDWNALKNSNTLTLTDTTHIDLSVTIRDAQGGVVSPSGELLYLSAGNAEFTKPTHGINVFDLSTGELIKQSTNGSGLFNYEFDNGPPDFEQEEPEGLTIWDLDGGQAPGIFGQLHVLLLDNDLTAIGDDDEVFLKHYTNTIHVDRNYNGIGIGTIVQPYQSIVIADMVAWDGARISVKAATYPETLTFSKRVQVVAKGGTATIGK